MGHRVLLMLPLLAAAIPALAAQSCKETAGEGWAKAYSEQCKEVSTDPKPPCGIDRPCDEITAEISRGCAELIKGGDDVPPFCKPELPPDQKQDAPGEDD
jgi:hypothetical protein